MAAIISVLIVLSHMSEVGREAAAPREFFDEARQLVAQGYKEIMLLGQNVNSYGKGLEESINFTQLLQQVDAVEGDFRVRFMTSHPKDCTREMIDTIAQSNKLCHHIHLPVQSGSNRILSQMNRCYDIEKYLGLIEYAKKKNTGFDLIQRYYRWISG